MASPLDTVHDNDFPDFGPRDQQVTPATQAMVGAVSTEASMAPAIESIPTPLLDADITQRIDVPGLTAEPPQDASNYTTTENDANALPVIDASALQSAARSTPLGLKQYERPVEKPMSKGKKIVLGATAAAIAVAAVFTIGTLAFAKKDPTLASTDGAGENGASLNIHTQPTQAIEPGQTSVAIVAPAPITTEAAPATSAPEATLVQPGNVDLSTFKRLPNDIPVTINGEKVYIPILKEVDLPDANGDKPTEQDMANSLLAQWAAMMSLPVNSADFKAVLSNFTDDPYVRLAVIAARNKIPAGDGQYLIYDDKNAPAVLGETSMSPNGETAVVGLKSGKLFAGPLAAGSNNGSWQADYLKSSDNGAYSLIPNFTITGGRYSGPYKQSVGLPVPTVTAVSMEKK